MTSLENGAPTGRCPGLVTMTETGMRRMSGHNLFSHPPRRYLLDGPTSGPRRGGRRSEGGGMGDRDRGGGLGDEMGALAKAKTRASFGL